MLSVINILMQQRLTSSQWAGRMAAGQSSKTGTTEITTRSEQRGKKSDRFFKKKF